MKLVFLVLIALFFIPKNILAASCTDPITYCCTLDTPGDYDWRLARNLYKYGGDCITITADDVQLHCDGYKITGFGTGTGINIDASRTIIEGCNIVNFDYGIKILENRVDNVVQTNFIFGNNMGLRIIGAHNNYIYDNYFYNSQNALSDPPLENVWHFFVDGRENIVGGEDTGGNFWHDYTGVDEDEPPDGFGDTPYLLPPLEDPDYDKDDLPLIDTVQPEITILYPKDGGTYYSRYVYLKVSLNEPTSFIGYKLDGEDKGTLWTDKPAGTYSKNIPVYSYGPHCIEVYAEDFSGNDYESNPPICFTNKPTGGGCPFVFTWNGNEFVKDNNLLPKSEKVKGDVEDYYLLHQPLVEKDGKYSLLLKEFEHEHDFFDQVKLLIVDHDSDFKVAVDPNYNILTYDNPIPPTSAVNEKGEDVLSLINTIDGENYYEGDKGNYITIDFDKVDSKEARLVMRADPFGRPVKMLYSIHVQVAEGEWEEMTTVIPRIHWGMEIVDISDYLPEDGELKLKLYLTANHRIDFVGLDTSEQGEFEVKEAKLISAKHSNGWNVKSSLMREDKEYAQIIPGQQIKLEFSIPEGKGEARDFILYSKGHYYNIEESILKKIINFFLTDLRIR